MKTEKQEKVINDKSDSRAEALADLPVTETQARQAKGGDTFSLNFTKIKFDYKPQKSDGSLS
jgi:type VI protein secretion system component Hcp